MSEKLTDDPEEQARIYAQRCAAAAAARKARAEQPEVTVKRRGNTRLWVATASHEGITAEGFGTTPLQAEGNATGRLYRKLLEREP